MMRRTESNDPRTAERESSHGARQLLAVLVLSTAASLGLQLIRQLWTGEGRFWHIAWDLFLAWVPLGLALMLHGNRRRGRSSVATPTVLALLWLLFFPNAPYLLTEFVHLGTKPQFDAVWWCDLVVILLIAWNGLLLGFVSLYLVQRTALTRLSVVESWILVIACLALGSLGITMGRFQRLNSWDALLSPRSLAYCFRQFRNPHTFRHSLGLAGLLTGFLVLTYMGLVALVAAGREEKPLQTRAEP